MSFRTDAASALARIERDIAAAQERARRAERVAADIAAVRGTGRSRRGDVVVEVDASGMLTDLHLAETALQQPAATLAAVILGAARAAQTQAGRRAVVLAEDAWGEDHPAVEHLRDELASRSLQPVLGATS